MDDLLSHSKEVNRAYKLLLVFPVLGQGCTEAQKDQPLSLHYIKSEDTVEGDTCHL